MKKIDWSKTEIENIAKSADKPPRLTYGYFQGQEVQALAYYKNLLQSETDPRARTDLQAIIDRLKEIGR